MAVLGADRVCRGLGSRDRAVVQCELGFEEQGSGEKLQGSARCGKVSICASSPPPVSPGSTVGDWKVPVMKKWMMSEELSLRTEGSGSRGSCDI